jgi:hypothetical protein
VARDVAAARRRPAVSRSSGHGLSDFARQTDISANVNGVLALSAFAQRGVLFRHVAHATPPFARLDTGRA